MLVVVVGEYFLNIMETNWEIIFLYHCFYIHDESQSLFHIDNLNTVELELL